ncbi:armadillo-type protein [Blastocladiella britannica]|nr:armadillo-type protein [Blastocladiella britannica]
MVPPTAAKVVGARAAAAAPPPAIVNNDDDDQDAPQPDPRPRLLQLASCAGSSQLVSWIDDEVLPLLADKDPRVLSPELFRALIPLTLHRYASQPKPYRAALIRVLSAALAAAAGTPTTEHAIVAEVAKQVDALVIKPTLAGRAPHALPLASVLFAAQWLSVALTVMAANPPTKLVTMHCTLVGIALHHPAAAAAPGIPRRMVISVTATTKELYKQARGLGAALAALVGAESIPGMADNLAIAHGALVELARALSVGATRWQDEFTPIVVKHCMQCKTPVPANVLSTLDPLLAHMSAAPVLAAAEKGLLRAPEVILPFLAAFLPARISASEPLAVPDAIAAAVANQLLSSTESIAVTARVVFGGLWRGATAETAGALPAKALAAMARAGAGSWQAKHNVVQALGLVPERLLDAEIDALAKIIKTEANDTVATAGFEVLAKSGSSDRARDAILTIAWPRVNDKVRRAVLGVLYDAGMFVPADKLAAPTELVVFAHVLQSGYDAERDAKKLAALLAIKTLGAVDAYAAHVVNALVERHPGTLTDAQIEHLATLAFATPHFVHLSNAVLHLPVVHTQALRKFTSAHFAASKAASSSLASRKHFLAVLHRVNAAGAVTHPSDTDTSLLLPLLLPAHHPAIPSDTWPALAFHAHVQLEHYLTLESVREAVLAELRSGMGADETSWERIAALNAASTAVWVDSDHLVEPLVRMSLDLIAETKAARQEYTNALAAAAEAAAAAPTPRSAAARKPAIPAVPVRSGSAGAKKPAQVVAAPAGPAEPVDRIPLALELIRAVSAHSPPLDAVIRDIVQVLCELDHDALYAATEVPATWTAVCACLDPMISGVHAKLATLLVTVPPVISAEDAKTIEATVPAMRRVKRGPMTESIDEIVSTVLFNVTMNTQNEPVAPGTFTVVAELMVRVAAAAFKRSRTNDKDVLNRILDHVAYIVDIYSQHAAIAAVPEVVSVPSMMRASLSLLRDWRKQAGSKTHETLVAIVHARPGPTPAAEIDLLLDEITESAGQEYVVAACLEAMLYIKPEASETETAELPRRMHLLMHALSAHPEYSELAEQVIEKHGLSVDLSDADDLVVMSEHAPLASCSAAFLGRLLARDTDLATAKAEVLHSLIIRRWKQAVHIPVLKDQFGMPIKVEKDIVTPRIGLMECVGAISPYLSGTDAPLKHWVPLLQDPSSDIRYAVQSALRAYVHAHAGRGSTGAQFIPVLQTFAQHKDDMVRESVVVLTGACAVHLQRGSKQLVDIVEILVAALRTPSESVQVAVAGCLADLPVDPKTLIPRLLKTLFSESNYGVQRGAAYGVAGLVAAHRSLFIDFKLLAAIRDNLSGKQIAARQGALLLLETCTISVGKMFEPWLILTTPWLLALFADTNTSVREATIDTARIMMKHISSHAVKVLMPTLLDGIQSDAWRTKKASIELLSSMAYCEADKLASALPIVIPTLLESLGDSQFQVSKASKEALSTFASVITTPEIELMAPMLLDALIQGGAKTLPALQALRVTTFEHYLDPPSLGLVAPVVHQGLRGRMAELKSLAAQILGNLTSLAPQRDLLYYVPGLMPALLLVVADAVPRTRAMATRTLGILVRNLGQNEFPTLVPQLFAVLDDKAASAVEKSGAAQGLAEVLAALGKVSLNQWMPTILGGLNSGRRDGYLVLLVFVPATFGNTWVEYIPQTLPAVLAGLADDQELVRESALRAAQILIEMFNAKAIDLLLPELIRGVFDPSWRIRQSSVQLLGDMLARIMGQKLKNLDSGKPLGNAPAEDGVETDEFGNPLPRGGNNGEDGEDEEDEEEEVPVHAQTHTQQIKRLVEALGLDMYQRTLASLYILRADASGQVRHMAVGVWRMLVSNTPRQIKDILPVMLTIILEYLARDPAKGGRTAGSDSDDEDKNDEDIDEEEEESDDEDDEDLVEVDELHEIVKSCSTTLVDVVRKLGDNSVGQVLTLLRGNLEKYPRGTCQALVLVMKAAGRQATTDHADAATAIVAWALNAENESVREAGAAAFDELLYQTGSTCIESVLMPMIKNLPESLSGLQHVMSVRGHVVLPALLPTLLAKVDEASCAALASLLSVGSLGRKTAGVLEQLLQQYNEHIPAAIQALLAHDDLDDEETLDDISSVLDDYRESCMLGVAQAITTLAPHATQWYKQQWIGWLLAELNTDDATLVPAIYDAMDALVKSIPKDELELYISTVAQALARVAKALATDAEANGGDAEAHTASVFAQHPRGPAPVLAVILHTLMYGAHKEQAVRALVTVIQLTPGANLRAHVTGMTGPLIRILGDRVVPVVKAQILEAVALLLTRVPLLLKPFIPQLSRTLVKQLETDDAKVLLRAQDALTVLMALHPRPDALVAELAGLIPTAAVPGASAAIGRILVAGCAVAKDPAPLRAAVDALRAAGDAALARELAAAVAAKF